MHEKHMIVNEEMVYEDGLFEFPFIYDDTDCIYSHFVYAKWY